MSSVRWLKRWCPLCNTDKNTHTHTPCYVYNFGGYPVCFQTLFGPEWCSHTLLVVTHADHLEEAGLQPSAFLTQASGWLRGLAEETEGGVFFLDNSRDWPSIRGRPLRDQLLRLSARNHHQALTFRSRSDSRVVHTVTAIMEAD